MRYSEKRRVCLTRRWCEFGRIPCRCADAKDVPKPERHQKLEGALEVSIDFHGDNPERIAAALKDAGAKTVRTK